MANGSVSASRVRPRRSADGGNGRGEEAFAPGARHEVRLVREVGGQQVLRRFVRRIHQEVARGGARHGDDGVVEVRRGDLGVHLRTGVDEDGVGLHAREAQEGDEQRGLVAADAVAVLEGESDVVRLVAGRVVLQREAHVADLLGDEPEEGANPFVLRPTRLRQRADGVRHRGRRAGEVGGAEVPVPARDGGPAGNRREAQRLHGAREGRHVRLGEGLRHVAGGPGEQTAPIGEGAVRRARHRVRAGPAHGGVDEREAGGRVDGDDGREDRSRLFEEGRIRPRPPHPGLPRTAPDADVADLAHGETGHRAGERAVEGIDNVRIQGGVVRRRLQRAREVDGAHDAVRPDDLHREDARVAVARAVVERDGRVGAAALLGENLDPFVVPGDVRAVGLEARVEAVVDDHAVRVGETRGGRARRRRDDLRGVGAERLRHLGRRGRPHRRRQRGKNTTQNPHVA